ncbi:MAG: nitroreductase family deazaflavin-dependent oxidoreductase [Gammaproteobacteria bacterium]
MVTKMVKESAAALDAGEVPQWITDHLREYRESGGKSGHYWDSTAFGGAGQQRCLLMTTIGRRSGKRYTHPLLYGEDGENLIIVGSKGGSDVHPAWYHNLMAKPEVELQVGPDVYAARATLVSGAERVHIWQLMTALYPPYEDYQARTTREIPLFSLSRID